MESTGATNKIQISESTAEILKRSGKQHWVKPREDAVKAKGKGVLSTFWLNPAGGKDEGSSNGDSDVAANDALDNSPSAVPKKPVAAVDAMKQDRLVDWMVEILLDHIKKIVSDAMTKILQSFG